MAKNHHIGVVVFQEFLCSCGQTIGIPQDVEHPDPHPQKILETLRLGPSHRSVHVSGNCGYGGKGSKALQHRRPADIARMKDVANSPEQIRDFGIQQSMRIGNHAEGMIGYVHSLSL